MSYKTVKNGYCVCMYCVSLFTANLEFLELEACYAVREHSTAEVNCNYVFLSYSSLF
jgi:hypothetical protein